MRGSSAPTWIMSASTRMAARSDAVARYSHCGNLPRPDPPWNISAAKLFLNERAMCLFIKRIGQEPAIRRAKGNATVLNEPGFI